MGLQQAQPVKHNELKALFNDAKGVVLALMGRKEGSTSPKTMGEAIVEPFIQIAKKAATAMNPIAENQLKNTKSENPFENLFVLVLPPRTNAGVSPVAKPKTQFLAVDKDLALLPKPVRRMA